MIFNDYFYSENWKDDEDLKNYLRSIKQGDMVSARGNFGTDRVLYYYMGFEIEEFISYNSSFAHFEDAN